MRQALGADLPGAGVVERPLGVVMGAGIDDQVAVIDRGERAVEPIGVVDDAAVFARRSPAGA